MGQLGYRAYSCGWSYVKLEDYLNTSGDTVEKKNVIEKFEDVSLKFDQIEIQKNEHAQDYIAT